MKLIRTTYLKASIWLLPILLIGSIFCFYMIRYIIYEETDEYLTYEMERIVNYHNSFNDIPDNHKITSILEGKKLSESLFTDTLMLEEADNEMVPHRQLFFPIHHNGKDFTIELRQLLPGKDDLIEGTLLIVTGLMIIISLIFLLMVNQISARLWKPFYNTLELLSSYKITQAIPAFSSSKIEEFNTLNATIETLLKKIANDYIRTKEFNENASHELQTHLAVIRANTESLINEAQDHAPSPEKLQEIFNATIKLSRVHKSLLLLSKIGNMEFSNQTHINLDITINQYLSLYAEAIELRNISLKQEIAPCKLFMDAGLADILINNLIKNAVKHNIDNGFINILLSSDSLIISNSGQPFEGNAENLLQRFAKGKGGNYGIGLAIVKQICELNNFSLSYKISKENTHSIQISFQKR